MGKAKILLIEDDAKLSDLVCGYLSNNQLDVATESRGDGGLLHILTHDPDLVLLDLMLPGISGYDVCRRAREKNYKGPILILTARDEEVDEILGLELGADDYLTKPIKPRVLLARIHSHLRRLGDESPNSPEQKSSPALRVMDVGTLHIDAMQRLVQVDGLTARLTTAEFDLLWLLAEHAGEVLSRDQIYQALRGIDYNGTDRSIDLRVARLRQKLGDSPHAPKLIKAVRGVGYMLAHPT